MPFSVSFGFEFETTTFALVTVRRDTKRGRQFIQPLPPHRPRLTVKSFPFQMEVYGDRMPLNIQQSICPILPDRLILEARPYDTEWGGRLDDLDYFLNINGQAPSPTAADPDEKHLAEWFEEQKTQDHSIHPRRYWEWKDFCKKYSHLVSSSPTGQKPPMAAFEKWEITGKSLPHILNDTEFVATFPNPQEIPRQKIKEVMVSRMTQAVRGVRLIIESGYDHAYRLVPSNPDFRWEYTHLMFPRLLNPDGIERYGLLTTVVPTRMYNSYCRPQMTFGCPLVDLIPCMRAIGVFSTAPIQQLYYAVEDCMARLCDMPNACRTFLVRLQTEVSRLLLQQNQKRLPLSSKQISERIPQLRSIIDHPSGLRSLSQELQRVLSRPSHQPSQEHPLGGTARSFQQISPTLQRLVAQSVPDSESITVFRHCLWLSHLPQDRRTYLTTFIFIFLFSLMRMSAYRKNLSVLLVRQSFHELAQRLTKTEKQFVYHILQYMARTPLPALTRQQQKIRKLQADLGQQQDRYLYDKRVLRSAKTILFEPKKTEKQILNFQYMVDVGRIKDTSGERIFIEWRHFHAWFLNHLDPNNPTDQISFASLYHFGDAALEAWQDENKDEDSS